MFSEKEMIDGITVPQISAKKIYVNGNFFMFRNVHRVRKRDLILTAS